MVRRLFLALLGLGAGLAIGVWAVRKVDETSRRLRPGALASSAGARASSVTERLRAAMEAGRAAAALKETELRSAYGVGSAPAS